MKSAQDLVPKIAILAPNSKLAPNVMKDGDFNKEFV